MYEVLVSIIIPVYNAGAYLERCLDSLCNQDYNNIEVVIVNDGSTDASESIINRYMDRIPGIKYIAQENAGVSAARNVGIEASTGEYMLFVDADDYVDKHFVSAMTEAMIKQAKDFVICGFHEVDSEAGTDREKSLIKPGTVSVKDAVNRALAYRDITSALWNKGFRASIIRDYGIRFNKDIAIGEDLLFFVEYCMHSNSGMIIPECLYFYEKNPNGAMKQKGDSFKIKWLSEWDAINSVANILKKNMMELKGLRIKKVRIADKLISKIYEYEYDNKEITRELKSYLRRYCFASLFEKDYSVKKKLSILINSTVPSLAVRIKNRGLIR